MKSYWFQRVKRWEKYGPDELKVGDHVELVKAMLDRNGQDMIGCREKGVVLELSTNHAKVLLESPTRCAWINRIFIDLVEEPNLY